MHAVDLTPIFAYLNEFVGLVLAGLAGWVVKRLLAWLQAHVKFLSQQTDQVLANGLNTALQNGTAIAMNKLGGVEAAHSSIEIKGLVQSMAAQYAINHAPQAIAHFGLDPTQLANKALAYLPPSPAIVAAVSAIPKGESILLPDGKTVVVGAPSPIDQTPAQEDAETAALNRSQTTKGD
jgi:hypothetical protein